MTSTIKLDTISEKTSGNGVVIDSVTLKDGAITATTADNTDTLTLTSTDADANSGPNLRLYRNSSSPAASDILGVLEYEGRNDNSEDVRYVQITSFADDVSDGTEDGSYFITTSVGGTLRNRINVRPTEVVVNEESIDSDFRIETNGNANMFVVDGGNDAVIFNGSTSNFASGSQAVQVYNSGVSFTSGYGIQGGANTDRASINLTSGSDGNVLFKVNNSEVARFTSGGLAIGGTGSANTLDDYEEGTWTPSGSNLGVATEHKAIYRKIGDIVVVYCDITYNSSPADTAQATSLSGLPFTCNDDYFQQNTRVATRNQNIRANISGNSVSFTDVADGVIMTRSEFAGNRSQHLFIYTTA